MWFSCLYLIVSDISTANRVVNRLNYIQNLLDAAHSKWHTSHDQLFSKTEVMMYYNLGRILSFIYACAGTDFPLLPSAKFKFLIKVS